MHHILVVGQCDLLNILTREGLLAAHDMDSVLNLKLHLRDLCHARVDLYVSCDDATRNKNDRVKREKTRKMDDDRSIRRKFRSMFLFFYDCRLSASFVRVCPFFICAGSISWSEIGQEKGALTCDKIDTLHDPFSF